MAIEQPRTLTLSEAYSKYGDAGLTEKGKNVRKGCIFTAMAGTALIITFIVICTLLILSCYPNYHYLFPTVASIIGGCFGTVLSFASGLSCLLTLGFLDETDPSWIETNPPIQLKPLQAATYPDYENL